MDVLVSIAPDVYGPYVTTNKKGQQVLIVECLNAVYGTMAAALLYCKMLVKSLDKKGFNFNLYNGCVANIFFEWQAVNNLVLTSMIARYHMV